MSASAVKRFLPLADRVLVQAFKAEAKTATGIYLPEAAKQSINQAKVISVGKGRLGADDKILPMSVKIGDTVIIPEYGGMTIKFDSEEYKLFRDDDIVGVMAEEASAAA
ncbi:unnamed protein product [Amoebophrya sp. A120]|nr:unnamed protein product [Amoebophrya sp. A120]|eukprot:GSA120T00025892001.1